MFLLCALPFLSKSFISYIDTLHIGPGRCTEAFPDLLASDLQNMRFEGWMQIFPHSLSTVPRYVTIYGFQKRIPFTRFYPCGLRRWVLVASLASSALLPLKEGCLNL